MSVFTSVNVEQLRHWLSRYHAGELVDYEGISAGIDNTNFFVTTEEAQFVLTLFERLRQKEVDYYLHLMAFLGQSLPCAKPVEDRQGQLYSLLNGKLAALIVRLPGKNLLSPTAVGCGQVGNMLARLHLAGKDYPDAMPHPRGMAWCKKTAHQVRPFLTPEEIDLLDQELAYQAAQNYDRLPAGVIHADLFRDNVLFEGDRITGIIDFYFAGRGFWLFDLAITVNDWCLDQYRLDIHRYQEMISHYESLRPLTEHEKSSWPAILRLASLRFWLSRLFDKHLPRDGDMVLCHDPDHFKKILTLHINQPLSLPVFSSDSL